MGRTQIDMESYETGYRDGESSRDADYFAALDDALPGVGLRPDDVSPLRVAALVRTLIVQLEAK